MCYSEIFAIMPHIDVFNAPGFGIMFNARVLFTVADSGYYCFVLILIISLNKTKVFIIIV